MPAEPGSRGRRELEGSLEALNPQHHERHWRRPPARCVRLRRRHQNVAASASRRSTRFGFYVAMDLLRGNPFEKRVTPARRSGEPIPSSITTLGARANGVYAVLHLDRVAHGVDHAAELDERAVAGAA